MKLHTTIEIDEIETEVSVEFEKVNAPEYIDIICIKESHSGLEIDKDDIEIHLLYILYQELLEYHADTMADRRSKKVNYHSL